ncbi:hypothetical protein OPU71_00620 [Niveibacterium sp. 24ML]|uniref:hypothetical protein n=1 Tax=Niveibacterium sp. 24ML TaxID=2985512 RepID=UPI00226D579D|nr:hypothetical protein [Niveibacterium sp. 24ML]MCX9154621.1 hypothetical protein [Niveibacterium sp. 24ML]
MDKKEAVEQEAPLFEGLDGLAAAVDGDLLRAGVLVGPHEATTLMSCAWKLQCLPTSWVAAAVVHPLLAQRLRRAEGVTELVVGSAAGLHFLCVTHRVEHWEQRALVPLLGPRAAALRFALIGGAPLAFVLVHPDRDDASVWQVPVSMEAVEALMAMPPVPAFDPERHVEEVRRLVSRLVRRGVRVLEAVPEPLWLTPLAVALPDAMPSGMLCAPRDKDFNSMF